MSKRSGFTLVELLVVIAIIALLAAILFPVFAQAREKASQSTCIHNQHQLEVAVHLFIQDNDETLPPAVGYITSLSTAYSLVGNVWNCPTRGILGGASDPSYLYNYDFAGVSQGTILGPTRALLFADGASSSTTYPGVAVKSSDFQMRHNGQIVASYLDGHVELSKIPPAVMGPTGGVIAYYQTDTGAWTSTLKLINADGTGATTIPIGGTMPNSGTVIPTSTDVELSFSPNGSQLVTSASPNAAAGQIAYHIYIQSLSGVVTKPVDITPTAYASAWNITPTFSPDGSMIVFASNQRSGAYTELYSMTTAGQNLTQLTTSSDGTWHLNPRFTPDGRLVFQTYDHDQQLSPSPGFSRLFMYDFTTHNLVPLTPAYDSVSNPNDMGYSCPAVRYDGQQILCTRYTDASQGMAGIDTLNIDGSNPTVIFTGAIADLAPQATYSLNGLRIATMHCCGPAPVNPNDPNYNYSDLAIINPLSPPTSSDYPAKAASWNYTPTPQVVTANDQPSSTSNCSLYNPTWGPTY